MPIWTYKILPNLPSPPSWLVSQIDRTHRPDKQCFAPDRSDYLGIQKKDNWKKQPYNWIQPMASNSNVRHHFNPSFIDWIKQNIVTKFESSNSGIMFFDEPQLPHTDVTRDFVLLYNLEAGGGDSELCFWQERGQDLIRERMVAIERGSHLELVDRVRGPFNCWYIVNSRIIHSVENAIGLRLNLQISFDTEIPADFYQQHLVNTTYIGARI